MVVYMHCYWMDTDRWISLYDLERELRELVDRQEFWELYARGTPSEGIDCRWAS